MKKVLVSLVALVMLIASIGAVAEVPTDIYGVVELAQSMIANENSDFAMNVTYDPNSDLVFFVTTMYSLDWTTLNDAKTMPEFASVISSLLETNIAMKDVVEACGLSQDVVGVLVTGDGAIVAIYYNDVDITPIVTGF